MTWIIVLCVLIVLFVYAIVSHSITRTSFNETEAEVIGFDPVYNSDYPNSIEGYNPIVKFEVAGKVYQGKTSVHPLWTTQETKQITVLYNPQNPQEFNVKEISNSPVAGCVWVVVIMIGLAIAVYVYVN